MHFEWDPKKEELNRAKHKISFPEAATVFSDNAAAIFDDPKHSVSEHREIIIGTSIKERVLLVSFTERNGNLRIISARSANKYERETYQAQKKGNS
jgi:uncharacterized DUF497 family protein